MMHCCTIFIEDIKDGYMHLVWHGQAANFLFYYFPTPQIECNITTPD